MTNDFIIPEKAEVKEDMQLAVIPDMDVEYSVEMYKKMVSFIQRTMRKDVDYGKIPGTTKDCLYKAGAEKLAKFFGFSISTKLSYSIEQWEVPVDASHFPLFSYRYTTEVRTKSGVLIATCDGHASSMETKYHWRNVSVSDLPAKYNDAYQQGRLESTAGEETELDFAISKKETSGKYGKPIEYWNQWAEDIAVGKATETKRKKHDGGEMKAWSRNGTKVRIPNEGIFDIVNTIIKIADKRSYVGGITKAASASEFFTTDLDDYATQLSDEQSIRLFVPSDTKAKNALIDYVESFDISNGGDWIKALFQANSLSWDLKLDDWGKILDLVDANLAEFKHE